MIQVMNNLNLLLKDDKTQTVKQQKVNTNKVIILNLKQKALNQVFVIILMHIFQLQVAANINTDVAFKNCAPISTCKTEINDVFNDEANHIYIAIPMYNLIEYSDNYSATSRSLWQFKRDKVPANNADLSINNYQSFKYRAVLVEKTANAANRNSSVKDAKIVVPLKCLSNFWRSLEMPLINFKLHLELNWIEDYILSSLQNLK